MKTPVEKKSVLKNLRFVWGYINENLKKKWLILLISLLLLVVTSLLEPYYYQQLVNGLTALKIDNLEYGNLLLLLGQLFLVGFLNMIAFWFYRRIIGRAILFGEKKTTEDLYQKVLYRDLVHHLKEKTGGLLNKVDRYAGNFFFFCYSWLIDTIPMLITFLAILCFSFWISWRMTLVTISLMPIYLLVSIYTWKKNHQPQTEINEKFNELYGLAYDASANIQTVKSFSSEEFEIGKFISVGDRLYQLQKKLTDSWANVESFTRGLSLFLRFIIFAGGVFFLYRQEITLGNIVFFLAISGQLYAPFQSAARQLSNFQDFMVRVLAARKIYEMEDDVKELPDAKVLKVKDGKIEFEKVTFHYEKTREGILKDISVVFEPGEVIALVGHSGAGKSTITSLLNRFYDTISGRILIDGQDIAKVTLKSLRQNIGMVMQDNTMFNDTIENNIRYGRQEATDQEIFEAAKKAQFHNFVESLPDKYQTKIGERGLKLSGGEKQRLAIARAILKNPPILILDEATSALDTKTEQEIQKALVEVMKGRTSIVIAHRLSTVRKADKIVVIDDGKVVQQGTHQELMKEPGVYQELVELQTQGFLAQ